MEEIKKNWYILFVLSGKEQAISEYLNHSIELHAFIIKKEMIHKRQGNQYIVLKPLFPSYLFIETELDHVSFQEILNQARKEKEGIIKELKYDDEIASLLPDERNYLEGLLDNDRVIKFSHGYMVNDNVVIIDGPLKGYESNIVKIDRHQRKAELEVKIASSVMNVHISLEIVKKI